MKIMTKKDFEELNRRLSIIEAHFKVTIDTMEEYTEFHCKDENLKRMLKNHATWAKGAGGPESLRFVREELMNRGVYDKGLRY